MPSTYYIATRPFHYLAIKDPSSSKKYFDWILPICMSVLTVVVYFWLFGIRCNEAYAIIADIVDFAKILPGFYIASLAAIVAFSGNSLDQYLPDPTPTSNIFVNGEKNEIKLTRRRFLSMQFAFLTAESILLCILGIFYKYLFAFVKIEFSKSPETYCLLGFSFLFFLIFWQLIVTTFFGLYYLGDRMHQPT